MRTRGRRGPAGLLACASATLWLAAITPTAVETARAARLVEVAATFGTTTVGASSDTFAAERKRVNRYALSEAGSVLKLSVYLAPTGTSGKQVLEGVIYSDSGGRPEALLGVSEPLTFTSSSVAGWYDLPFAAPIALAPGNYWIGVITGPTAKVAGYRYTTVTGARDYNSNTYAAGPSNPFGSVTTDAEQTSLYATYTPAAPPAPPVDLKAPTIVGVAEVGQTLTAVDGEWENSPQTFEHQWLQCNSLGTGCAPIAGAEGQTYVPGPGDVNHTIAVQETARNAAGAGGPVSSLATAPISPAPLSFGTTTVGSSSEMFAAERKRVNRYALSQAASVSKLNVYLTPTGSSGKQVLKGVIYSDSGGRPEALLGVSEQLTFTSSSAAGWYELPFAAPVALAAGNYWIGVITGPSAKIAGYRYTTVAGARDYNSNSYSAGPSNPFGSFTTDSQQISLYASYTTGPETAPPSEPQELHATAVSPTQIDLSWEASSDEAAIAGYTIRRDGVVIANTGTTATSYQDKEVLPSSTYTYTVEAYDVAGHRSPQSAVVSETTPAPSPGSVTPLEYVFDEGSISVYDIAEEFKLVKTISLPQIAKGVRGVTVSPATHMMFISYGGDGGTLGTGYVLAYNLVSEQVAWTVHLSTGVDDGEVSPNGKLLYMPTGENEASGIWNILNAENGSVVGKIKGGAYAHDTIAARDGRYVYLGGRNSNFLDVYEPASEKIVKELGPLVGGVRPFTVNGSNTLAFTTATGFDGFQVSSVSTGKVLYTVSFGSIPGGFPFSTASHGISLSPNEKQLYVIDAVRKEVQVWNVAGVGEGIAPSQIGVIPVAGLSGEDSPCVYDCSRSGWLQLSTDGRFLFVGDSGEVIETATRKVLMTLSTLANTKKSIEIDWENGVPVATSGRIGVGQVE